LVIPVLSRFCPSWQLGIHTSLHTISTSQLYGDLGEKNLVSKTCPDFVPAGIHTF
jgi:hypothetical protein